MALPLLLATAPSIRALSMSVTGTKKGASRSLVDQARMIRGLKNGSAESRQGQQMLSMDSTQSVMDKDALSAALFDDGFNNSLESAVKNRKKNKKNGTKSVAMKSAEEFDRFMEEDATVASIVQENIRPGSLVNEVQQNKGADIVNMESVLQREAAERRAALLTSPITSPVKVTPKSKVASKPRTSSSSPEKQTSTKSNALLTRDQEYALAYRIQDGTRVHKLKTEYETANSQPPSKKQWAELAGMSSNDLRKVISDYRTAKQELVSCNMGLVRAVCKNYARKAHYRGIPVEELVQEGSMGLIRAAELFDPAKGLRFSTYATIWIKGVLSNSNLLEEVIRLPMRERTLWNKVRATWEEMEQEKGDGASQNMKGKPSLSGAKELAKRLDMDPELIEAHLKRMACVTNVLSLDYQYATATRSGYSDNSNKQDALMNVAQFGTDADLAEKAQFKADVVASLVRNLTEKELTLMRLRYGLEDGTEYTIKECASKMGINRETARLLQHKCLEKLRTASNMESLQEYLLTVA
jgi:RNA polymerase primary sigma factor